MAALIGMNLEFLFDFLVELFFLIVHWTILGFGTSKLYLWLKSRHHQNDSKALMQQQDH